jgi:hypothetical protein
MKQFYILAFAGLMSFGAVAQKACAPAEAVRTEMRDVKAVAPALDGDRETIWATTFANCDEWAFANQNEPGIMLDWECGPGLAPSGPAAIAAINSATADDGFLMVDSDLAGGEAGLGVVENAWADLVTPFNTVGHPGVAITFANQYRMWDNGNSDGNEYCLVEVSRDGTTWPDLNTFEVSEGYVTYDEMEGPVQARWELWPDMATQDPVANPTQKTFNITGIAGDQETVYIRFRWKGIWGYAWMIDDLEVFDAPDNDLTLGNYTSYTATATSNLYEYGAWAESQLPDTLTFAAEASNFGNNATSGVYGILDVNGEVTSGAALEADLATGETDTVYVDYPTGGAFGMVNMSLTLQMDSMDADMSNNTVSAEFEVTGLQWGRDNGEVSNLAPADGTVDYIQMPLYQVLADVTVYGVDVAIMDGSEDFTPVRGFLVDVNADEALTEQYGGELTSSPEIALVPGNTNDDEGDITWYTFVFDEPYEAVEGDFLGAAFEHYGGANVQIGEAQDTEAQTAFVYGPFGSGQAYDWYYTTEVPMVRLNLNPDAVTNTNEAMASEGFEMFPAFPNPTTDNTRFQFRLDQAAEVTFELRDITGKLVEVLELGAQPAGMNNFMVETSAFGAGSYTATLVVNGARITQKLMVK